MKINKFHNIFTDFFYNRKAGYLLGQFDFFECMNTLRKYDKFETLPNLPDMEKYAVPCRDWIFTVKDRNDTMYDMYYKNLHFHIERNDMGEVIRVFLKKMEEDWILGKKGASFDPANPENKYAEIYRRFNISIYGEEGIERERFIEGKWNREVSEELEEMTEVIEKFTDLRQISDSYRYGYKEPEYDVIPENNDEIKEI